MGFEHIFVGTELCCHSAIQLFSSGRAKNYDSGSALLIASLGSYSTMVRFTIRMEVPTPSNNHLL
jgi:hypothetical protein